MNPKERRINLLDRMVELESTGLDCSQCSGKCCTYEANSMMTTPSETRELLIFLKENQLWTTELIEKINVAIKTYRLDQNISFGKKTLLRRTYTCPFFNHGEYGCPLPREVKPYGCLAFNSHHPTEKASEHCYSETDLLEKREKIDPNEFSENEELKMKFHLWWDKLPLPYALIELNKSMSMIKN